MLCGFLFYPCHAGVMRKRHSFINNSDSAPNLPYALFVIRKVVDVQPLPSYIQEEHIQLK
jgi:hypothetical protein